jgi:glutamyl-tRNA reductase
MKLHVWGTDFRRSSGELRAKLACSPENRERIVGDLLSLGFPDLVYLSTCNRVEFYTTAPDHFVDTRSLWLALLKYFGLSPDSYYQGFHFEGKGALRHLLRVASSLESLVVGEPQILGQLKEALSWHQQKGFRLDRELERLFQLAFETARKVRAETAIAEKPTSVASLGISHLLKNEAEIPLTKAVVVGRSPISLIVLQFLQKNRPDVPVLWVNRTFDTIAGLEEAKKCELWRLDEFLKLAPSHSHLFTATSSLTPLFTDSFFKRLDPLPRMVFDFAQPPDILIEDAALKQQVHLVDLQGLEAEAAENREQRKQSVVHAEAFIETSLRDYCQHQKESPLMKEFSSIEPLLSENLQEALQSLSVDFESDSLPKVQRWAENLVKKQLHFSREHLRNVLKQLAGESKAPLM